MALKYKVGDKVRIKSIDWYNENKDADGDVQCGSQFFIDKMIKFCGKTLTISKIDDEDDCYIVEEDDKFAWTDEMIEGLVEEKSQSKFDIGDIVYSTTWQRSVVIKEILPDGFYKVGELYDTRWFKTHENNLCKEIIKLKDEYILPNGYIFKDENGNVINTTKIVLEKVNTLKTQSDNMEIETHKGYCTTEKEITNESKKIARFTFWDNDFADKVELELSDKELIQEDGKWFVVKKKKEYPKTYKECCITLEYVSHTDDVIGYKWVILQALQELLICRDAYWKIAGEEMGLGKPWKPDFDNLSTNLEYIKIVKGCFTYSSRVFAFPTPEMRDAFYENFKDLIEQCKELL